jgi:hypothetical protein
MSNDKCIHHEAVDVRLNHLEDAMRNIKRMFWAIILLLLVNLASNYSGLPDRINKVSTHAHSGVSQNRVS